MASVVQLVLPEAGLENQAAWNEAHDRLENYLKGFALGDRAQVSRLTLQLLDRARELHRLDPSCDPVSLTMEETSKWLEEWFSSNLELRDRSSSQVFASGCVALLLSHGHRTASEAFLVRPLPEGMRESMRQTLLVTGPDLNISSMTPRRLDYGPMLDLAKNTWHRWNIREILVAFVFWSGVYVVFYWWLSDAL